MRHEWVPHPDKPYDWDGAVCLKCGLVASNAEIATMPRSEYNACPGNLKEENVVVQ